MVKKQLYNEHFLWQDNVSPPITVSKKDHLVDIDSCFSDLSDLLKKFTELNENLKLWRIYQMPLIATVSINRIFSFNTN